MRRLPLLGLLALSLLPVAHAADQTVLGSALIVKNPSTPDKRKITVTAKEAGAADHLVGEPGTSGATVTVTANGGTPSGETFVLPAGASPTTSRPFWTGDGVTGFRYSDAKGEMGPVKSAQIRLTGGTFHIKVAVAGSAIAV